MKKYVVLIFFFVFPHILIAQDTTKILFIGNSFTAANNLYALVQGFFDSAGIPAYTYAYAPGGISVGDTSQGTNAHMNNPLVFQLIRQTDWDYLVLQDNQGRFVLDSGVFPASSKVIEGHLKIRDSLHYYHSCAKMIWFSGWAYKNGLPPQWPTGFDMIDAIATNYRVLNDTAKDVIAPIGGAWKISVPANPSIDLWATDETHPSLAGSFLTAALIYGVITQSDPAANSYTSTLSGTDALVMKAAVQHTLTDTLIHKLSNIYGILPIDIIYANPLLKGPAGMALYHWYINNNFLAATADSSITPLVSGNYRLWTMDSEGYWQKSCELSVTVTSVYEPGTVRRDIIKIFPDPASDQISVENAESNPIEYSINDLSGRRVMTGILKSGKNEISVSDLSDGVYCMVMKTNGVARSARFIILK